MFDGYGADSYKLGGGNDTYYAQFYSSTLIGQVFPDPVDFVDGGAGRDTYIGLPGLPSSISTARRMTALPPISPRC